MNAIMAAVASPAHASLVGLPPNSFVNTGRKAADTRTIRLMPTLFRAVLSSTTAFSLSSTTAFSLSSTTALEKPLKKTTVLAMIA